MLIHSLWLLHFGAQSRGIISNQVSPSPPSVGTSWLAFWLDSLENKIVCWKG